MLTPTSPTMIAPNDLANYAEFQGWQRGAPYGNDSHIYVSRHGQMIVLPSKIDAPDYVSLADQAVRVLAELSNTDPRTMHGEIKLFNRDIIRIRAIDSDTQDGSINLRSGRSLIENSWNVLKALAKDVKKSASLKKRGTERLLEGFRLEQTEVGSYALAITTPPVPHTPEDQMLRAPQRLISQRMADALGATRQLTNARQEEAPALGPLTVLSAAWCRVLADMVEPFDEVEFGLTWARTAPLQLTPTTTFNSTDDVLLLRQTADELQQNDTPVEYHNVRFPGYIEVLKHPKPANSQRTVIIKATFSGRYITIKAVLAPDDYSRACRASESKSNVFVSGSRLFKAARSWELEGTRIETVIASTNPEPMSVDQPRMAILT